jgi:hypothetical protein
MTLDPKMLGTKGDRVRVPRTAERPETREVVESLEKIALPLPV